MPESLKAHAPAGHNLCGVLVHARAAQLDSVHRALAAMPGVEVHERGPGGRLVVTIEDSAARLAADTLSDVHHITGVLGAALVYHHCEPGPMRDVVHQGPGSAVTEAHQP